MAETRTFELFDSRKIGDPQGGIEKVRIYQNSIIPYFRTRKYDALMCRETDLESSGMRAREVYHNAVCQRIARNELDLRGIIPSYVLEKTHGGSERTTNIQARALGFLASLVQGGANIRIATYDVDDVALLNAGSFSLVEYQDDRPGELVLATSAGDLVMAREEEEANAFTNVSKGFETVWEDRSTIKSRQDVMGYLRYQETSLESRPERPAH